MPEKSKLLIYKLKRRCSCVLLNVLLSKVLIENEEKDRETWTRQFPKFIKEVWIVIQSEVDTFQQTSFDSFSNDQ